MNELKCEGMCCFYGECKGEVRPVEVSGQHIIIPIKFNYCQTAIDIDTNNDFIVKIKET